MIKIILLFIKEIKTFYMYIKMIKILILSFKRLLNIKIIFFIVF